MGNYNKLRRLAWSDDNLPKSNLAGTLIIFRKRLLVIILGCTAVNVVLEV